MKCLSCLPRASLVLVLASGLVLVAGCKKNLPQNSVSGQVKYNDGPLPFGKVQLWKDETTLVGESPIRPDGTYTVATAATGPVKICVQAEMMMGDPRAKMAMPPEMMKMMKGEMPPGMEEQMKAAKEGGSPPMKMRPPRVPPRPVGGSGDTNPPPDPMSAMANNAEMRKVLDKLNKKYGSVKTTDLTFDVQAGEQKHNIALRP
jgi:hypothetical protein